MMSRRLYLAGCCVLIALLALPSFAIAEDSHTCAVVKLTNSHAVALRETQSTESKRLHRLYSYEILIVAAGDKPSNSKWTEVLSVPRLDGYWDNPLRLKRTSGWVHSSLLAISKCPQEPIQINRAAPMTSKDDDDLESSGPPVADKEDLKLNEPPLTPKEDFQE